jgi:hydroxymethylglutaryl-CoA reductase
MEAITRFADLTPAEQGALSQTGALGHDLAEAFIENAVGAFSLPLGIATNFLINDKDVLIPMAVEESSVVAAASHGAKLARIGGGFTTSSSDPIMTAQVQLRLPPAISAVDFETSMQKMKESLIEQLNRGQDRLIARGGGVKDLTWYAIPAIKTQVVMLHAHTADAMGANIVNTMAEKLAKLLAQVFPKVDIGLRILTNLTTRRTAHAECTIPAQAFTDAALDGHWVVERIVQAWEFAWHDPYRAATHNKGVMNGIDPVAIVTGNDWRAIEAGAHAHCALSGHYRPMTIWQKTANGSLHGTIDIPMAVGTVGGVTKLHPTAQAALRLLGHPSAQELAEILCAVGLAQNLSALRALATEGIQAGHMALHQKNLDILERSTSLRSASPLA